MTESTETGKVVNLFDHKNEEVQEQAINAPDITEELKSYDAWVQDYANAIDKALFEESESTTEKRDISLPLEALIRVFAGTTYSLDVQLNPEELPEHDTIREKLADHINASIGDFIDTTGSKVYQQDIFISLSYIVISYLQQQRRVVLTDEKLQKEQGVTEDANQNQPE